MPPYLLPDNNNPLVSNETCANVANSCQCGYNKLINEGMNNLANERVVRNMSTVSGAVIEGINGK